jgi:two-component system, NarL family, invasion response regulator UvrY
LAAYRLLDAYATEDGVPSSYVRLLLADSDPLARTAVREGMKARSDLRVVAEAADSSEVLLGIGEHGPDVVLADTDLPPWGASIATRKFIALDPALHVVLFSVHVDEQLTLEGLNAGACGVLPKDIDMSALARALSSAARGEAALSRRLSRQMMARLRVLEARITEMRPLTSPLTDRQWEVLGLLTAGHSVEQISDLLNVSIDTARGHVRMVLRRLGAETPTEAVRVAECLRMGRQECVTNQA